MFFSMDYTMEQHGSKYQLRSMPTCLTSIGSFILGTFFDIYDSNELTSIGCLTTPAILKSEAWEKEIERLLNIVIIRRGGFGVLYAAFGC